MSEKSESDYISDFEPGEHVSTAVLRAIAAVSNRPVLELSPLAESLDVDSLDRLFASSNAPDLIQFEYEGYEVTVEQERVCLREKR